MSAKIRRVLFLLLALCLLLPSLKANAAQDIWEPDGSVQATEPEHTLTVLGTVTRGDLKNTDKVSASKYYPYTTTVTSPDFQVNFIQHLVKRNDRVKAGDPLVEISVTIDPIELARAELNLRRAEDSFAQNMAQREDSLLVLKRQADAETDPFEKEILQLRLQKQTLEFEQYRARQEKTVQAQRDHVNSLKTQSATTTIYSPVDGVVIKTEKSPSGTTLAPNTALVTIADESVILLSVTNNTFLTYGMETEVVFNGTEEIHTGRVVATNNFLCEYPAPTNMGNAYVLLNDSSAAEVTTNSARVTGALADYKDVVLAPYHAVFYQQEDNYHYVYCLVDGQAQKRQVRVLHQTGDRNVVTEDTRYWILWGVDAGDTLLG